MIDFTLTEKDRQLLDQVRAEALVCRKYARYYDEHEEEFIPDEFPSTRTSRTSMPISRGAPTTTRACP
jgi:acyl-CoA dehydrogenase